MRSTHSDAKPRSPSPDVSAADAGTQTASGTAKVTLQVPYVLGPEDANSRPPTASERAYCGPLPIPATADALATMVDHTHPPHCKLELWATLHRRHAFERAQRDAAAATTPHRRTVIDATLKSTIEELDNEVTYLHNRHDLTEPLITDLIDRKEREFAIEDDYGVNLTNHPSVRGDGSKIVWNRDELEQIAHGLELLPPHAVGDNPMMAQIERWNRSEEFPDSIGGYYPELRVIRFYDPQLKPAPATLARHSTSPLPPARISHDGVERAEDLTHEIGHTLQYLPGDNDGYRETELYSMYARESGWQKDVKDEQLLRNARLHPTHIEALRRGEKTWPLGKDGLIYQPDKYGPKKVLARRSSTIPESKEWAAAATGPEEQWAEHVSMAVLTPAQLALDMFEVPAARLAGALRNQQEAQRALDSAIRGKASPKAVRKRRDELDAAQAAVVSAQYVQRLRKRQFEIIRIALRGNIAAEAARERLQRLGVSGKSLADFQREATRLSTPHQIAALESKVLSDTGVKAAGSGVTMSVASADSRSD